jgi:RNA polymerase primary sigma factor
MVANPRTRQRQIVTRSLAGEASEPAARPLGRWSDDGARGVVSPARGTGRDSLGSYLREVGKISLLTQADEVELGAAIRSGMQAAEHLDDPDLTDDALEELEFAVARGEAARRRLIESNLRLVVRIASRYQGRGLSLEDLVSEGNFGLMRAVERFDERRGFKFSTYACWWIMQAVGRALADHSRIIRLPVHLHVAKQRLAWLEEDMHRRLGRDPLEPELAKELNISVDSLRALRSSDREPARLEMVRHEDDGEELGATLEDDDPGPVDEAIEDLMRDDVVHLLDRLPMRERRILELRYGLADGREHTLAHIGRSLGLTRERVRQLERQAIFRLRSEPDVNALVGYLE